ncbi:DMT family transporter [Phocicoccus pinnipedialis]|uniref:Multidrug resistance protein YkkD n=1 Tax=Phocicoccus pinnipedialis TaxID=110845 RepID=A0A6V7R5L1_9BACL|nr:multidrug efflux SMR transporter [Jeotgalicoccus pinnipedialis]MBP1939686.1 paired small multidrug resistance pump [Jeotgalicoccus pinnipedialis]CAD2072308.1 Multidrug resistance protein YkkD [Jeotgalicoccus pinnipedialis]
MIWFILICAGLFELLSVVFMNRFTVSKAKRDILGIIVMFSMSFALLTYSLRYIEMSTAYAVWTGIGAVGGALVGMLFYNESKNIKRMLCIALILGATIGLKMLS